MRNLGDGRVEALFEGNRADVETTIEWCKRGPIKADVTDAELEEGKPQGDFDDFEKR